MAEISVPRKSACGHDCEECAGCGVSGASVRAVARNDARAEVGQKVVVESSTKNLLGVMLLVYLLPIVLFLVGYFATGALESEGLRYAVAIAAFLVGIIPAIICDRRTKKNGKLTFTIVRLFLRHVWLHQAVQAAPQRAGRSAFPVRLLRAVPRARAKVRLCRPLCAEFRLHVPCYSALRRAGAGMRELPLRGASVQGTVRHGAHRRARNGGRPQSGARLVAASRPY